MIFYNLSGPFIICQSIGPDGTTQIYTTFDSETQNMKFRVEKNAITLKTCQIPLDAILNWHDIINDVFYEWLRLSTRHEEVI